MTSRTQATFSAPVMEARRWIENRAFPPERPLLNLSQAAPVEAPPLPLRQELARLALDEPQAHLYGPVLGLPELRSEIAAQWSAAYGGQIEAAQVAITSGCNQAFTATMATLCGEGDEVILPTPYYFNHRMALDMAGITHVALPVGDDMLPDPDHAARLITPRSRAIVLVSPNNPGGVEYPAALVAEFATLARKHGLALVIDETYRDFDSREGARHGLFADPDWDNTLIQLYSFSKAFRLTGHRVGAILASPARLAETEKYLDTVTICPNQLGQMAALWGLRNLRDWLAGERREILSRAAAMRAVFADLPGWELRGCGAYFAYLRHPFDMPSDLAAQHLVAEASVLTLPGTMFRPASEPAGAREVRIAFANVDAAGIAELGRRLAALRP